MNVTLRRVVRRLHFGAGIGFSAIVVSMLLAPSATYLLFPWVRGFMAHAVAYSINAALFFATAYLMSRSLRAALPYAIANVASLIIFGTLEYTAGALYGLGDVAFGLVLLVLLNALRPFSPEGGTDHHVG